MKTDIFASSHTDYRYVMKIALLENRRWQTAPFWKALYRSISVTPRDKDKRVKKQQNWKKNLG